MFEVSMTLRQIHIIFILLLSLIGSGVFGQKIHQIEIHQADEMIGKNKRQKFQKLIGNVVMSHEGVFMYCDSAYWYNSKNFFEAFGQVRIKQGDSILLTGRHLYYDGNESSALIKENVVFKDNTMTLKTESLHYDIANNNAWYNRSATIIDTSNTLTSQLGYYYSETKDLFFKKNVVLKNEDFTLKCDTLQYNIRTKIAWFKSPTDILGEGDDRIYTEDGWYSTTEKKSLFKKNAFIVSDKYYIKGQWLFYNNETGYAKAKNDVTFRASDKDIEVKGQLAERFEEKQYTYVTDSVLFINYLKNDTLYLSCDSLKVMEDSLEDRNTILAFHDVLVYSTGMQVKCDSLAYIQADSLIHLFFEPVIWSDRNQITADKMVLFLANDQLDRIVLKKNCFMAEEVDSLRFNQVKGKDMLGYFHKGGLYKVDVQGNAQCIYYLSDELEKVIGVSHNESSFIRIMMENKKINTINFISQPTGEVIPPKQDNPAKSRLDGFYWRGNEKPENINDLFLKRKTIYSP